MTTDRARRLYRVLLLLAPRRLRRRHREEMEALFAERLAHADTRGARLAVWARATADLLSAALAEPFRRRHTIPGPPEEHHTIMIGSDLRYTLRWLARQKHSSALVVAMLSIGIAANVVVFSLISALFLRPFPFPDSDRLVFVNETAPKWNLEVVGINYPDFHQWMQSARAFDALALFDGDSFNLSDGSGAERIEGAVVTWQFAQALGIQPILGRMFTPEEDRPKAARVVVIGQALWQERFGGSSDVLGRTLKLDGVPHTIVGVMPRTAEFPGRVKLWVPMAGDPNQTFQNYSYTAVGRLKSGVTVEAAEQDLLRAHEPIWNARDREHNVSPFAHALREEFVRDYRATARTLFGAVALLLVIACANVASVMLARALARRREIGIRLAVGASRARLLRQLLLENLVLAAVSGVVGLILGRAALRLLLSRAGDQVPAWASFALDARVLAFSALLVAGTALLFGLAPAAHATRVSLRGAIQDTNTAITAGPRGRRTLRLLVAGELAIAAVLLTSGGLLWRAYERVRDIDPGFRPDHVLTFQISIPDVRYDKDEKRVAFWDRVIERFQATPGVEAAGLVSCPPLSCHSGTFFVPEGRPPLKPGEKNPVVLYRPASPTYFTAMGVRLKAGRFFEPGDGRDLAHRVAIVNETFANTFWPGVDSPVGRRFRANDDTAPWITVVGFVEDVKHYGLERPMRPGIYQPIPQDVRKTMTVAIRTTGDPAAFTETARRVVRELDPELPVFRVRTMEQALQLSLANRMTYSWMLGIFAGVAFVLALGGSYGVTSYLVSQRTRELGIRIALGAQGRDIVRTVLAGSLTVAVVGVLAGIAVSFVTGRFLETLLFGVPPHDPRVLIAAGLFLLAVATLANWLPARRAAHADPLLALRVE